MKDESKHEQFQHDLSAQLAEPSGRARSTQSARLLIRRAKQASRRRFPAEEKIRILLEGVRGEVSVSELCRREGIHPTIYYKWMKDFMEAGKARMRGDSKREATSDEVQQLRQENDRLKQLVADLSLSNLVLKKSLY
jgi:transposase